VWYSLLWSVVFSASNYLFIFFSDETIRSSYIFSRASSVSDCPWPRLPWPSGHAGVLSVGTLVGTLWASLWAHCGLAGEQIVGTLVGTLSARLPSFSNKANSSCVLHIPPVNKRSETKLVLILLATEGWGVAVLLIEQPFKSTTPTLGPWCAP